MQKITPVPHYHNAESALKWLCEKENHGLDESGLTDIVRMLITKVNELSFELDYLRNKTNQHDSFI